MVEILEEKPLTAGEMEGVGYSKWRICTELNGRKMQNF